MLIKKYGNRRLYDTEQSRYITLEELADLIRKGKDDDVHVVGAKSGEDLTTATLAQIIFESRGAARLLPVPILIQLIRLGDSALAEFLGTYVAWALEAFLQARRGVQALVPFNPFLLPGAGLARIFGQRSPPPSPGPDAPVPDVPGPAAPAPETIPPEWGSRDDVAALRREVEELKGSLKKKGRR